jgi:predicted glycosyltransferase
MNREAAALGVPVYSIFRGKIGAVDRYLADNGRLVLIEHAEDLRSKITLVRRSRPEALPNAARPALAKIVNDIVMLVESEC